VVAAGGGTDQLMSILDKTVAQADRAGQIIRRLRSFLEKGETERRIEPVNRVVEEAVALALVGAKDAGIRIELAFAHELPEVMIDRIQIQQVVLNLVRNAIEAMERAPLRELTIATRLAEADEIETVVSDTGPGLAPEVVANLFQPFVSTKSRGMGLGLSICRTIIEAHGGRLTAEARPGGGTTFRFTLPRSDQADPDA
jgi:two-component system sensor kinase FixL